MSSPNLMLLWDLIEEGDRPLDQVIGVREGRCMDSARRIWGACLGTLVLTACGSVRQDGTQDRITPASRAVTSAPATQPRAVVVPASLVEDAALYVSMDFPRTAAPGDTVRFEVTCDRPPEGHTALSVALPGVPGSGLHIIGDVTIVGSQFYVDWLIPLDAPLGEYTVRAWCDGPSDVIDPDEDWPEGINGPLLPFTIAMIPPTR